MKPAKTIALLQQKGGSGKTTTSLNIAGSLKEQGFRVAICDMDKDKPEFVLSLYNVSMAILG